MQRKIIDLSIYLENDVISDPVPFGPKIHYHKHEDTAGQIAGFFPGLILYFTYWFPRAYRARVVATLFLGIGEALLLISFFELIWRIGARKWMPDVFALHPSLLGDFNGSAQPPGAPERAT